MRQHYPQVALAGGPPTHAGPSDRERLLEEELALARVEQTLLRDERDRARAEAETAAAAAAAAAPAGDGEAPAPAPAAVAGDGNYLPLPPSPARDKGESSWAKGVGSDRFSMGSVAAFLRAASARAEAAGGQDADIRGAQVRCVFRAWGLGFKV